MVRSVDGNESSKKLRGTAAPGTALGTLVRHMKLLLRAETS